MAPVETARAVQVTVGGTAAMLGEAAGQMATAARAAMADSADRLAVSSHRAKVPLASPQHCLLLGPACFGVSCGKHGRLGERLGRG